MQKRSPRNIQRGFGKPTADHAPNVQIFVNDCAIAHDQRTGGFVLKIPPQIADPLMLLLQQINRFCPSFAALLSASNLPLRPPQLGTALLQELLAIARRHQCVQVILETTHAQRFYLAHGFQLVREREQRGIRLSF